MVLLHEMMAIGHRADADRRAVRVVVRDNRRRRVLQKYNLMGVLDPTALAAIGEQVVTSTGLSEELQSPAKIPPTKVRPRCKNPVDRSA
jgi:hypothetical protein